MREALVFTVPMPPNVTNRASGRSHWRVRHNERTAYWELLDGMRVCRHIPQPPPEPIPQAVLASHMVLGGAMDDDNALARHKHLVDWLVRRGYLASDRRTCVRWAGLPEQRVSRKVKPTITLTITPAP